MVSAQKHTHMYLCGWNKRASPPSNGRLCKLLTFGVPMKAGLPVSLTSIARITSCQLHMFQTSPDVRKIGHPSTWDPEPLEKCLARKVRRYLLCPQTPSQRLAVKEFYFTASRISRQFFVKFLAPTFPGNWRTKIGEKFSHFVAAFFAHVGETFRQNFALGAFRHNIFKAFI